MNRNIPAIFAISALIVLIFCSACTAPSSGETKEGGLTQVTIPVEIPRISFEDAKQKLGEYRKTTFNESLIDAEKIYYVLANDVDESGNAASWVFGVKNANTTELLVYNGRGWTAIPWIITTLPSEIIDNRIIFPKNLFAQNKATIFSDPPGRRDIELKDGIYTVTITSGTNVRTLTFKAFSGAPIE